MGNVITHNSRTDRRGGFKLGGNHRRGGQRVWHTLMQTVSENMADIRHKKMQKLTENVAKSAKFCTLIGNRSRGIERRYQNLRRKFINNRFCATAVQMLLKMAVNATICSTFKAQYGKSTSSNMI